MYLVFKNVSLIHSKSENSLEYLKNHTLVIHKPTGKIVEITPSDSELKTCLTENSTEYRTLSPSQFIIPGFIDTHTHAPQYGFTGTGLDLTLLDWLEKYTFPYESMFSNLSYAEQVYSKCVRRHLRNGSTTVCYYGTIHLEATKLLADIIETTGMRGYVGKVCMDRNSPKWYVEESSEKSLEDTRKFSEYVLNKNNELVRPIITPRFAPTCTDDLLRKLANLACDHDLHIQTHLSENDREIEWVKQLFPDCSHYTDVYFKHGLLTDKTVLAHCVYLNDDELNMIKKCNSGISHCPNSNISMQSGLMSARYYMNKNVKVSLGTDVAGGYSASILDAIRNSIAVSKIYSFTHRKDHLPLSVAEAFYLATMGGASVLELDKKVGNFEVGKEFDALVVDFELGNTFDCFVRDETSSLEEIFEKFIYLGDDRNICDVFVKGKLIYSAY